MWQKLKKHLEKIQNSDEATKKRWLIGTTAVAMVLVIGLWLIYINLTIKSTDEVKSQTSEVGFWQIFKTGIKVATGAVRDEIKNFISKISGERTVIIE